MKKYIRYSEGYKEQALAKAFSLGNGQTLHDLAETLGITLKTLKKWMKKTELNSTQGFKPKRPQDWSPEERLAALHKTYGLIGEGLSTWCREHGVFAHQLEQWNTDFCRRIGSADNRDEASAIKLLKAENQRLEHVLLRKDRALAEAAALLVLQKKFRALLGGEVE
jgi:transposase-like protein